MRAGRSQSFDGGTIPSDLASKMFPLKSAAAVALYVPCRKRSVGDSKMLRRCVDLLQALKFILHRQRCRPRAVFSPTVTPDTNSPLCCPNNRPHPAVVLRACPHFGSFSAKLLHCETAPQRDRPTSKSLAHALAPLASFHPSASDDTLTYHRHLDTNKTNSNPSVAGLSTLLIKTRNYLERESFTCASFRLFFSGPNHFDSKKLKRK